MPALAIILISIAAFLVFRILRQFTIADIETSLRHLRADRLLGAGLFTVGSYAVLTTVDLLAIRSLRRAVSYPRIALASFVSLSVAHTIGIAPLSSGTIRYRFYSQWGLSIADVAKILVFSAATIAMGEASIIALSLLANRSFAARMFGVQPGVILLVALCCVLFVLAYLVASLGMRHIRILRWRWNVPGWRFAAMQVALGALNFALVAGALAQVLGAGVDYSTVATAFVAGNLAALLSHTPGGLGVIEAVVIELLPNADTIGPVIAFRVVYFLIPFAIGLSLFLASELARRLRRPVKQAADRP